MRWEQRERTTDDARWLMFTVKATIKCYRCDASAEVDCEVESFSVGNSDSGRFVVKSPDAPDDWAELTESYYYGRREDAIHFYCPKHWKKCKDWPHKEAVY